MTDDLFILSYRSRVYKIPKAGPGREFHDDDTLYSWLINDWIVKQPDSEALMTLFIRMGFNMPKFLLCIFDRPDGSRKRKAA